MRKRLHLPHLPKRGGKAAKAPADATTGRVPDAEARMARAKERLAAVTGKPTGEEKLPDPTKPTTGRPGAGAGPSRRAGDPPQAPSGAVPGTPPTGKAGMYYPLNPGGPTGSRRRELYDSLHDAGGTMEIQSMGRDFEPVLARVKTAEEELHVAAQQAAQALDIPGNHPATVDAAREYVAAVAALRQRGDAVRAVSRQADADRWKVADEPRAGDHIWTNNQ